MIFISTAEIRRMYIPCIAMISRADITWRHDNSGKWTELLP